MPTYSSNEDEINQLARLWEAPPAVDLDAARRSSSDPDIVVRQPPISEDEARELLVNLQSSIERTTAEQLNRLDNTEVERESEEQIEARIEAVEALSIAESRRQRLDTYRGTQMMAEFSTDADEAPVQESVQEADKEIDKPPVKRKSRYQILKESVRPETQSEDSQALHRKISWEKDTTV